LIFLNCRRLAAYSVTTLWIVSAPMCSKTSVAPAESLHKSNPVKNLPGPEKGRAARTLVSFAQFQT
jgi:hypothetical protein